MNINMNIPGLKNVIIDQIKERKGAYRSVHFLVHHFNLGLISVPNLFATKALRQEQLSAFRGGVR
ncbi:hypothetical protein [Solibacillus sp. CAU 1738]|uniref:hypothetical protein n=1 Tax=Solibacillus sp. CAU 1738 TaxID=3140363 RepID=UPI003260711E